jgi:hypothetical protein
MLRAQWHRWESAALWGKAMIRVTRAHGVAGLVGVAALAATGANAGPLVLVRDGAPAATIVVAAAAGEKVKTAAQELQTYLAKLSGATLPLQTDAEPVPGAAVLVGASRLTEALRVVVPSGLSGSRREEGYVIVCRGDRLVLAGNNDGPYHGTEYAVYEFLRQVGVRWFMPGDFGEIVPSLRTIKVAEQEIAERPDFVMRNWWLHAKPELAAQERLWKLRNRMNPDTQGFFCIPGDSSARQIVRPELLKDRPELFALNPDGTRNPYLPNLSNPEAVAIAVELVKKHLREPPGADSYGFAPDDGLPRDYNPETVKLNPGFTCMGGRPGVPAEMSTSEEWIGFVNRVTAAVRQDFPDAYIATNGYANRDIPPQGITLDDHLVIMFAAIWSCTLHGYDQAHCWQKVRQGQMLQRWAAMCPNVWVYGYNYQMLVSGLTPLPEFSKLRRDFPLMKKWGVLGFHDESRNVWAEAGIASRGLRARLEWDADADVDAFLDDLFERWYGPAAKPMKAFYMTLDKEITESTVHGHEDRCLPELYTPALLDRLGKEMARAEAQAGAEPFTIRVRAERLIYDHLAAYVEMNRAELAGEFPAAAAAGSRMLALRPELHAINPFFIWLDENGYHTGVWYWKIADRVAWYTLQAERQNGKTGDLLVRCPDAAEFCLDPHDEGLHAGWYTPQAKWPEPRPILTSRPFYRQGYEDPRGFPHTGVLWYRFDLDVPATASGRKAVLVLPTLTTEGWCWVNGRFVGSRPYLEAYTRPSSMECEVTAALKPGAPNEIVLRVSTSLSEAQAAEGLYGRAFLFAPRPAP